MLTSTAINDLFLNLETVSDAKSKTRNIIARWLRSIDDQSIFNTNPLQNHFQQAQSNRAHLIGKSRCGVKPFLLVRSHKQLNEYMETTISDLVGRYTSSFE